MKKSKITEEQMIGLQKQARLPDAVAPMQGDPGAAPAGRQPPQVPRSPAPSPARGSRMAQFPIVRGSADFGPESPPIVRG